MRLSSRNVRGYDLSLIPTKPPKHELTRTPAIDMPIRWEKNPRRLQTYSKNYRQLRNAES